MLWKEWEGQTVNGRIPLIRYLGGSEYNAVFETEYEDCGVRIRAAIKLILTDRPNSKGLLSRWEQGAKLSHSRLIRFFEMDQGQLGDIELVYLVMEYADEDLSKVLLERCLAEKELREVFGPVL